MKEKLSEADLGQFYGTTRWFQYPFNPFLYTEGAQYVFEKGGAYWLLDLIAANTCARHTLRVEGFVSWKLAVNLEKQNAFLVADDGNGKVLFSDFIGYTDFPLPSISFFVTGDWNGKTIMLPSEY
jgi:hypothetical protein